MGYSPTLQGEFYRCAAIYRDGDNPTALSINKNTGRWSDFVSGISNAPFEKLIDLTLGDESKPLVDEFKNATSMGMLEVKHQFSKEEYMKDDVYSPHLLKNLLNLYTFYEKRGISQKTQEAYASGYASSGKMYGRIVFPIYNEENQLIGFAGRDVYSRDTKNCPKWKLIGKKKNFVYPFHLPGMDVQFMDDFNNKGREVILVESIGDSMALYQNGMRNNLVCFGLACQESLAAFLNHLNPDMITIAFNNDANSSINRGLVACVKTYLALTGLFSPDKVRIKLPLRNDFGDMVMSGEQDIFDRWKVKGIDMSKQRAYMKQMVLKNPELFTKKEAGLAKKVFVED
jgi:hypothetical protein